MSALKKQFASDHPRHSFAAMTGQKAPHTNRINYLTKLVKSGRTACDDQVLLPYKSKTKTT